MVRRPIARRLTCALASDQAGMQRFPQAPSSFYGTWGLSSNGIEIIVQVPT